MLGKFSILILALAFPALCDSQNLKFAHIGTQDGLSQMNVTCIMQEVRGFIWIGTDDGLNRYDGYRFVTYHHDPKDSNSLSSNSVIDIKQDNGGNLWVATKNGLNKLDLKTGRFIRYMHDAANPNSISGNRLNRLALDADGNLWIATESTGLDYFDIKKNVFKHYIHSEAEKTSISHDAIVSIYNDSQHRLWIATINELSLFDKKTGSFIKFPDSKAKRLRSIFEDSRQQLWIGTQTEGLFLFNPTNSSFTQFKHTENVPGSILSGAIISLNEDEKGNLWVGSENAGLSILDKSTGKFLVQVHDEIDRHSINGNSIYAMCKDRVGNMWLGAYNAGISLYKRNTGSFIHYRHNSAAASLSNNFVWDIFEDRHKNIWVATDGGGVNKFDAISGKITNYRQSNGLSGNYVLVIEEDDDGDIWMGTWGGGISLFNPKKNKFSYIKPMPGNPNSVSGANVYALARSKDNKMWIGTIDGGLNCYDRTTNTFTHFISNPNDPKTVSSNSIFSLLDDRAGNLWIGTTDDGLNFMDRKTNTFTRYRYTGNGTGLSNNSVPDISEDRAGNIWISTFDGLDKFDPKTKTFTVYTTQQGLPSNIINAAREADDNKIWISTNHGLSAYNPATGKFKNYTTEDGLQDEEFKPHSALKASDGKLYFGGINGFNEFSPSDIVKPMGFCPIMITSFQIFNKPFVPAKQEISDTKKLSLSYKQTFFSIEYAALDFSSADKKNYAFMLDGFDKEWNYVGSRNTTSYTNVPAGHYIFKVKYQNGAGPWSPEYSKLQIIVKPPFWLTWWFITLVALAAVGCIYAYTRIRIQSIKKQKINLEDQVHNKTAEIVAQNEALEARQLEINHKNESLQRVVAQKDRLLMEKEWLLKEIHHRVKNNFHIVASLLEIQSSYLKNQELLSAFKETQHRIHSMSIIHQKLYQSETLSTIRMPDYIYELVEYLRESYSIRDTIAFSLQIENIELNHASAITLGLILNEAITNAIKYAFANTHDKKISISLSQISDSQIFLSVADNGCGLPADFGSKIGASMGMELLQGLTDDLGGSLTIEANRGTHIKVIFDYKRVTAADVSFSQ
jgi:ligand-binding sensor domain-containing protein/two-component sensor histidine kinase